MRIIGAIGLMGLAALAACASQQKKTESLKESSWHYQEGLRWARFEESAALVPAKDREAFLDEHDKLGDDLRIDDYDVVRIIYKSGSDEAQVQVKYKWHLDGVGLVKETVTDQRWKLHGNAWLLEDETKRRGEDMPGVDAAPDKAGDKAGDKPGDKANRTHAPPAESAPAPPAEDSEPVAAPRGNASGSAPL
jgi:hypothetical protein